jgi:hypothetical protein
MALVACCTDLPLAAAQPHARPGEAAGTGGAAMPEAGDLPRTTGRVVETMNAGEYTYVQIDDGTQTIWAAAPHFAVAAGDKVVVPEGAAMRDFHSKTLQRTFDLVYFAPRIDVIGVPPVQEHAVPAHAVADHGMTGHAASAPSAALDLSNIRKADGGHTVAELFANKATLAHTDVSVRGRVVKFTPAVMGKNWIHVQDGSGSAGSNDLAVSTSATAAVGDTVLVRGALNTDRDFGFGYHYDIIIEDANVTVE